MLTNETYYLKQHSTILHFTVFILLAHGTLHYNTKNYQSLDRVQGCIRLYLITLMHHLDEQTRRPEPVR